jgi:membrane protease YdiL (CAAX protease family)
MPETQDRIPVDGARQSESWFRRLHPAAFVILALGVIFVLYQVIGGGAAILLAGGRITPDTVPLVRWSTLLGQILLMLLPTILLTRLRFGSILQPLRLHLPRPVDLLLAVIALLALQQVLQGYMLLQEAIPLPLKVQQLVDMLKELFEETYRMLVSAQSPGELIFVVVTVALVPAVCEELLFRGLVQRDLESAVGGGRSAVFTGIIFGLFHLNPLSVVPLIALGVFFGFLVYRSQNITLAMVAHFLNNFLATVAVYFQIDEDFMVVTSFGSAGAGAIAANTALFALVFLGVMYYFVRITGRRMPA